MVWLRALTSKHLDLTLEPTRDIRARVLDRPGAWLSPKDLGALVADVRTVARATLPEGDLRYGILGGDKARLSASVITVLYDRQSGTPIAFNALVWLPVTLRGRATEVLHLGLVMVDPAARNRGMSWLLYGFTCFVLFLRHGARPLWISNVTAVPAVFGMVSESFSGVFPSPTRQRPSFEQVLLARQIMSSHRNAFGVGADAGFDESRFVITNAYTGGSDDLKKTFEEAPKHRNVAFNDICVRDLDYQRGDDFLQLGQMSMSSAQTYVWEAVPRESLPGVLLSGLFLLAQATLLPVLHWFDASTAWGSLRPVRARA